MVWGINWLNYVGQALVILLLCIDIWWIQILFSYCIIGISFYVLATYFLAAIESKFLRAIPYEIELIPQEEYRSKFCYSVAECRASYPRAMDRGNDFFKVKEHNDIFLSGMNEDTKGLLLDLWLKNNKLHFHIPMKLYIEFCPYPIKLFLLVSWNNTK